MAFKLKNTPYPKDKKPKRRKNKNSEGDEFTSNMIELDDGHEPYSTTSISRSVTDKKYDSGEGKVSGLDSKLTYNPETGMYTRTQIESSPAYLKRKGKKRKKK